MILPIYVYGNPVLRKSADKVTEFDASLSHLISNMFETMYAADGVGLAAPQVGVSKQIIVIDTAGMDGDDESLRNFKKVLINPEILEERGDEWSYNEGCLSLPTLREDIKRKPIIRVSYCDEQNKSYNEEYDGIRARVIQHEIDHLKGRLFIDRMNPLKKRLANRKLNDISQGKVERAYRIVTTSQKKK